jgi:hypothetical protein
MNGEATRSQRTLRDRAQVDGRRRYLAPRLVKGPMLAGVTAGDTVISGVPQ